jgi:hypothetical protein
MSEQLGIEQEITGYASLLNAAHLISEEAAVRLHELAKRYPDALPPEVVERALRRLPWEQNLGQARRHP